MVCFFSFFFSPHRYPNEVINPIWVGIGPFRLFWLRSLKWKEKQMRQKRKKNESNFYECWISFSSFFSSHRYPNELINPIWVGIVPFRLFW